MGEGSGRSECWVGRGMGYLGRQEAGWVGG